MLEDGWSHYTARLALVATGADPGADRRASYPNEPVAD
jgi:hypothetical protein